jgi:hypothetical protein
VGVWGPCGSAALDVNGALPLWPCWVSCSVMQTVKATSNELPRSANPQDFFGLPLAFQLAWIHVACVYWACHFLFPAAGTVHQCVANSLYDCIWGNRLGNESGPLHV